MRILFFNITICFIIIALFETISVYTGYSEKVIPQLFYEDGTAYKINNDFPRGYYIADEKQGFDIK